MGFPKRYLEATDVKLLSKTPVRGQEVEEYRWLPIVKNSFSKSRFSGDFGMATMQGSGLPARFYAACFYDLHPTSEMLKCVLFVWEILLWWLTVVFWRICDSRV